MHGLTGRQFSNGWGMHGLTGRQFNNGWGMHGLTGRQFSNGWVGVRLDSSIVWVGMCTFKEREGSVRSVGLALRAG